MLSRKYYQKFAEIISEVRIDMEQYETFGIVNANKQRIVDRIETDLINMFESDDPNFDREKFTQTASID